MCTSEGCTPPKVWGCTLEKNTSEKCDLGPNVRPNSPFWPNEALNGSGLANRRKTAPTRPQKAPHRVSLGPRRSVCSPLVRASELGPSGYGPQGSGPAFGHFGLFLACFGPFDAARASLGPFGATKAKWLLTRACQECGAQTFWVERSDVAVPTKGKLGPRPDQCAQDTEFWPACCALLVVAC